MKIITQPKVYLLSRPYMITNNFRRFLDDQGFPRTMIEAAKGQNAEVLVEMVTRLCYQSFKSGRGSKEFHENLLAQAHGSTIEHANWTLLITGVSRSFSHELVRHRAGFAYSQLSQRYVDASDVNVVMPPAVQQMEQVQQDFWTTQMEQAIHDYADLNSNIKIRQGANTPEERLKARKVSREAARSVLPNAVETHIAATANARAWRHFFEMRTARFAEAEMRRAAYQCYLALKGEAPFLFGDYKEEMVDGSPELTTPYPKV